MNLYEAIAVRQSIRDFEQRSIESSLLEKIEQYQKKIVPLYPEITYQIEIINQPKQRTKKNLFQLKAPYYLRFFSEEKENALLNAGYVMEELCLYLTSKGIGTCYQGWSEKTDDKRETMSEMLTIAFGYSVPYLYRDSANSKRYSLNKICIYKEEPSKEIITILKAAALAPSSFNSQPWRFIVYKNRIHICTNKLFFSNAFLKRMQQINIGIVLSHISIAAEELWLDWEWKRIDSLHNQHFKNNEYIISFLTRTESRSAYF